MGLKTGRWRAKGMLLVVTALTGAGIGGAEPVWGQVAPMADPAAKSYDYDIPTQSLSRTVTAIVSVSGLQVFFPEDGGLNNITAPVIKGRMTVDQALTRATAGTGFIYRYARPGVITLVKAPEGNVDGEKVTGAVRVEGAQGSPYFGGAGVAAGVNGTNGSRDITATEGTKSFTSGALTVGSKVPQALKDVPQSISVLTSERLEQQNVTDFTTAMNQLPGITLVQGATNLESTFYSRGFAVTSIQVDGGAPLSTSFGGGQGFYPQIDMSIYDHVELLRGADGLFNGYGSPSGSVNLVRKKPLDHAQYTLDAQAGSWDNYRVVADATTPLAFDGKLRGRLVMTVQDEHHFYEVAKDNKTLVYGILEFDVTPRTLLTAGLSYTKQDSVPWYDGLPRYQTGADLQLPRSTAFAFPWNRWNFETTEIFGGLEQKIGKDWTFKINLTDNDQSSIQKVGYVNGYVNPLNDIGASLGGNYATPFGKQFSAEGVLAGAFKLFGQRQEVTLGINRVDSDAGGQTSNGGLIRSSAAAPYQPYQGGPLFCTTVSICPSGLATPPVNVFNFNPNSLLYNEPPNPPVSARYLAYGDIQWVGYLNLRLTAFDRVHLTTGIRWSEFDNKSSRVFICTAIPTTGTPSATNCVGRQIGDSYNPTNRSYSGRNFSWPPSGTLSFDVTKQLTAYAGYTDIYISNASKLDINQNPLGPVTGSNWEAGLKWAARGGKLNLSLAAYSTREKGLSLNDNSVPSHQISEGVFCCYVQDPNAIEKSQGIDAEATGEIIHGWQVSASYTFNQNEYVGSDIPAVIGVNAGTSLISIQPKSLYKLWTSYDFGAARKTGWLSGLTISGGVNGQSSGYYAGATCVNLLPPNPVNGNSSCVSNSAPNTIPYSFTVPAYAVFSGRIDYRFSGIWSLAVNLENILDKTYYQTVGPTPSQGNWYGAPRSVTVSLRGKW